MEILESESKGVRASGYERDGNRFLVLKGSFVVEDSMVQPSLANNLVRMKLRKHLISEGKIQKTGSKYQFVEDVEFNSPSEAASVIWGSNLNGRKVFGVDGDLPRTHKVYYKIEDESALEGYRLDRQLYTTKRDREIVKKRKEMDNYTCQVCNYRMEVEGKYVIDCHHLNPVAIGGERQTTIDDLVSLCPTCHRIIHTRKPIFTPDQVKKLLKKYKESSTIIIKK